MQLAARDNGWTQFSAMENHYNLLYREDEHELDTDMQADERFTHAVQSAGCRAPCESGMEIGFG